MDCRHICRHRCFHTHVAAAPRLLWRCHRAACRAARVCLLPRALQAPDCDDRRATASSRSALAAQQHCWPCAYYTTADHGGQPGRVQVAAAVRPGPTCCWQPIHALQHAICAVWPALDCLQWHFCCMPCCRSSCSSSFACYRAKLSVGWLSLIHISEPTRPY